MRLGAVARVGWRVKPYAELTVGYQQDLRLKKAEFVAPMQKTIHGREARQKRADTSSKLAELYELEVMARVTGVITGPKVRGRKPKSF